MKRSKNVHTIDQMWSLYIGPILISMAFAVGLFACGDSQEHDQGGEPLVEDDGPPCPEASWLNFSIVSVGTRLEIEIPNGMRIHTAIIPGLQDFPPAELSEESALIFESEGTQSVFVVTDADGCSATVTRRVVEVVQTFPTDHGVDRDDPRIQKWASSWQTPIEYGEAVTEMWQTPERAMGPASGQPTDIVSLGAGGRIELFFDGEIFNGEGPDFAVFENSFSPTFLEIAVVEVSSDGVHFAAFPTIYLGTAAIDPYGDHEPGIMYGFAGRFPAGVGTPFDLEDLRSESDVLSGLVNLERITSIRLTDIVGDGSTLDSLGNPIYDPYPTAGSAGFDLDAVGVMHIDDNEQVTQAEQPE